jgi:hypothetical protein
LDYTGGGDCRFSIADFRLEIEIFFGLTGWIQSEIDNLKFREERLQISDVGSQFFRWKSFVIFASSGWLSNLTSKIENLKFGAQKESLLLAQKAFWGGAGL